MIKNPRIRVAFDNLIRREKLDEAKKLINDVFSSPDLVEAADDIMRDIALAGDSQGWIDCLNYILQHYHDHEVVKPRPLIDEYISYIDNEDLLSLAAYAAVGRYLRTPFKREDLVRISDNFWFTQEQYFKTLPISHLKKKLSKDALKIKAIKPLSL